MMNIKHITYKTYKDLYTCCYQIKILNVFVSLKSGMYLDIIATNNYIYSCIY